MMINDLRIKTQLVVGFLALLVFPVVLGWFNFKLNKEHEYQPENLYNNPVCKQRPSDLLSFQIVSIQQNQNSLFLEGIERILLIVLKRIEGKTTDAREQPEVIRSCSLKPIKGIDALKTILNDFQLEHVPVIAFKVTAMKNDREIILAHDLYTYILNPSEIKAFVEKLKATLYGK